RLVELPKRKIRELWREKAKKLSLPGSPRAGETATRITDLSPDKIDVIYSKQGETLRFAGLPFARVRTVLGKEQPWFGTHRDRRILTHENWDELAELTAVLDANRSVDGPNKRHEYYRAAPEAWLES